MPELLLKEHCIEVRLSILLYSKDLLFSILGVQHFELSYSSLVKLEVLTRMDPSLQIHSVKLLKIYYEKRHHRLVRAEQPYHVECPNHDKRPYRVERRTMSSAQFVESTRLLV